MVRRGTSYLEGVPVARMTREDLSEYLAEEILSGRLEAGARLPAERELVERFGLSRPTLREVLRSLHERGLVEIVPAQGTFVRNPSMADGARSLESYYRRSNATARELMDARLMLETHAVRLAASAATPVELKLLDTCMTNCENARNVVDGARQDLAFHALLARASHNCVIETMFVSIAAFTFELMLRSLSDASVARRGLPHHRHVLDAIRAGEPDLAADVMRAHLSLAQEHYGVDYDRSIDRVAREIRGLGDPGCSLDALLDEVSRDFQQLGSPRRAARRS